MCFATLKSISVAGGQRQVIKSVVTRYGCMTGKTGSPIKNAIAYRSIRWIKANVTMNSGAWNSTTLGYTYIAIYNTIKAVVVL